MKGCELRAGPLVVRIDADGRLLRAVRLPAAVPEGITASHLADLLDELRGFRLEFADAPPFFRRVWEELGRIPWGSARTYAEVAGAAGRPRAFRAVGQACGANRLPLVVPCHRVVAQAGPGGFSAGMRWKLKLLELESAE